jgi:hypothetical protein
MEEEEKEQKVEFERDDDQPEPPLKVDGDDWYDEWVSVQLP